jgi:hypothetical protein
MFVWEGGGEGREDRLSRKKLAATPRATDTWKQAAREAEKTAWYGILAAAVAGQAGVYCNSYRRPDDNAGPRKANRSVVTKLLFNHVSHARATIVESHGRHECSSQVGLVLFGLRVGTPSTQRGHHRTAIHYHLGSRCGATAFPSFTTRSRTKGALGPGSTRRTATRAQPLISNTGSTSAPITSSSGASTHQHE